MSDHSADAPRLPETLQDLIKLRYTLLDCRHDLLIYYSDHPHVTTVLEGIPKIGDYWRNPVHKRPSSPGKGAVGKAKRIERDPEAWSFRNGTVVVFLPQSAP